MHVITKMELGGAQISALQTVTSLDRTRYETWLVTGEKGELMQRAKTALGDSDRLVRLPTLVREIRPIQDFRTLQVLTRVFLLVRPDIVHTHSSKAGFLGRLAARRAGVPVIVHTIHGFPFHPFQPALIRWIYVSLERRAARWSRALIVVTSMDSKKGILAGVGHPSQYRVIRCGIDLQKFASRRTSGSPSQCDESTKQSMARRIFGISFRHPSTLTAWSMRCF